MQKTSIILIVAASFVLSNYLGVLAQNDNDPVRANQKESIRTIKYYQLSSIATKSTTKNNHESFDVNKLLDGSVDVTMAPGETKQINNIRIGGFRAELFFFDTILEIPNFMTFSTDELRVGTISGTRADFTLTASNDAPLGDYTIRVKYSFHFGGAVTSTVILTINLTIAEPIPAPTADFSGSPRNGEAPLTVNFNDQSSGQIDSWDWEFGDGGTSTSQSPSHTYQNAGTYTVKLTVTGPGGSDSRTRSDYITVTERFWADIDGDNDVDVVDIQIVAGKWNTKVGESNYDPRCDVDNEGQGDGDIDIVDIQLVAGWWNKPIPPGSGSSTLAKVSGEVPENVTLRVNSPIPSSESAGSYYVDVMIENAVNLGAFQFDVVSKDKGLKIEGVELGSFLKNIRNRVISLGPEIDMEGKKSTFGAFSYCENLGPSGSGVLARLRLTSSGDGVLPIELDGVKVTDTNGNLMPINRVVYASVAEAAPSAVPKSFFLSQNYPNPFNPTTKINFDITTNIDGKPVRVGLYIYNLKGQLLRKLVDEEKATGYYSVQWDGRDDRGKKMVSGIYFYSMVAGDFKTTRKMILVE